MSGPFHPGSSPGHRPLSSIISCPRPYFTRLQLNHLKWGNYLLIHPPPYASPVAPPLASLVATPAIVIPQARSSTANPQGLAATQRHSSAFPVAPANLSLTSQIQAPQPKAKRSRARADSSIQPAAKRNRPAKTFDKPSSDDQKFDEPLDVDESLFTGFLIDEEEKEPPPPKTPASSLQPDEPMTVTSEEKELLSHQQANCSVFSPAAQAGEPMAALDTPANPPAPLQTSPSDVPKPAQTPYSYSYPEDDKAAKKLRNAAAKKRRKTAKKRQNFSDSLKDPNFHAGWEEFKGFIEEERKLIEFTEDSKGLSITNSVNFTTLEPFLFKISNSYQFFRYEKKIKSLWKPGRNDSGKDFNMNILAQFLEEHMKLTLPEHEFPMAYGNSTQRLRDYHASMIKSTGPPARVYLNILQCNYQEADRNPSSSPTLEALELHRKFIQQAEMAIHPEEGQRILFIYIELFFFWIFPSSGKHPFLYILCIPLYFRIQILFLLRVSIEAFVGSIRLANRNRPSGTERVRLAGTFLRSACLGDDKEEILNLSAFQSLKHFIALDGQKPFFFIENHPNSLFRAVDDKAGAAKKNEAAVENKKNENQKKNNSAADAIADVEQLLFTEPEDSPPAEVENPNAVRENENSSSPSSSSPPNKHPVYNNDNPPPGLKAWNSFFNLAWRSIGYSVLATPSERWKAFLGILPPILAIELFGSAVVKSSLEGKITDNLPQDHEAYFVIKRLDLGEISLGYNSWYRLCQSFQSVTSYLPPSLDGNLYFARCFNFRRKITKSWVASLSKMVRRDHDKEILQPPQQEPGNADHDEKIEFEPRNRRRKHSIEPQPQPLAQLKRAAITAISDVVGEINQLAYMVLQQLFLEFSSDETFRISFFKKSSPLIYQVYRLCYTIQENKTPTLSADPLFLHTAKEILRKICQFNPSFHLPDGSSLSAILQAAAKRMVTSCRMMLFYGDGDIFFRRLHQVLHYDFLTFFQKWTDFPGVFLNKYYEKKGKKIILPAAAASSAASPSSSSLNSPPFSAPAAVAAPSEKPFKFSTAYALASHLGWRIVNLIKDGKLLTDEENPFKDCPTLKELFKRVYQFYWEKLPESLQGKALGNLFKSGYDSKDSNGLHEIIPLYALIQRKVERLAHEQMKQFPLLQCRNSLKEVSETPPATKLQEEENPHEQKELSKRQRMRKNRQARKNRQREKANQRAQDKKSQEFFEIEKSIQSFRWKTFSLVPQLELNQSTFILLGKLGLYEVGQAAFKNEEIRNRILKRFPKYQSDYNSLIRGISVDLRPPEVTSDIRDWVNNPHNNRLIYSYFFPGLMSRLRGFSDWNKLSVLTDGTMLVAIVNRIDHKKFFTLGLEWLEELAQEESAEKKYSLHSRQDSNYRPPPHGKFSLEEMEKSGKIFIAVDPGVIKVMAVAIFQEGLSEKLFKILDQASNNPRKSLRNIKMDFLGPPPSRPSVSNVLKVIDYEVSTHSISAGRYYNIMGFTAKQRNSQRWRVQAEKKNPALGKIADGTIFRHTAYAWRYNEFCRWVMETSQVRREEYQKNKYRQTHLQAYRRRKAGYTKLVRQICCADGVERNPKDCVLLWGDGSWGIIHGHAKVPNRGLFDELKKFFFASFLVDEYRTSKLTCCCHKVGTHGQKLADESMAKEIHEARKAKKPIEKPNLVKDSRTVHCTGCGKSLNRDCNAAINILENFLHFAATGKRLKEFKREEKAETGEKTKKSQGEESNALLSPAKVDDAVTAAPIADLLPSTEAF